MKKSFWFLVLVLMGCSDAEIVSTWKNPDIVIFNANKVLVVGMTQSPKAREIFETEMKARFTERGIEAMRSIDLFDVAFTNSTRSQEELDAVEQQLLDKDFDAILFTKILGSEKRQTLSRKLSDWERTNRRFKDDYLTHQDIYYNDEYYDEFTVYLVETSLYCICVDKERDLIWQGVIEVSDPIEAERTIDEFIDLVTLTMEKEELIFREGN